MKKSKKKWVCKYCKKDYRRQDYFAGHLVNKHKSEYYKPNKLSEIPRKVFEKYWDRKNRLAIVKFNDGRCLVFLVEDVAKPQIPGYPATAVEYFDSHEKAVKAVKETYRQMGYTPEFAEYGYWYS